MSSATNFEDICSYRRIKDRRKKLRPQVRRPTMIFDMSVLILFVPYAQILTELGAAFP